MSAINKWNIDEVRRATEEKGPRSYKSRNSSKMNLKLLSKNLSLMITITVRKKIFLKIGRKDICFVLIPRGWGWGGVGEGEGS